MLEHAELVGNRALRNAYDLGDVVHVEIAVHQCIEYLDCLLYTSFILYICQIK